MVTTETRRASVSLWLHPIYIENVFLSQGFQLARFAQFAAQSFFFCRNLLLGTSPCNRVFVYIHKHERRQRRELLLYEPILFLLDESIVRVSLRDGSQFGLPEQLTEVLPLIKAYAIRQRHRVLRQITVNRFHLPEQAVGGAERLFEFLREASLPQFRRDTVSMKRRE